MLFQTQNFEKCVFLNVSKFYAVGFLFDGILPDGLPKRQLEVEFHFLIGVNRHVAHASKVAIINNFVNDYHEEYTFSG